MILIVEQIKAARILLGWDQVELARQAGLGVATIRRIEAIPGPVQASEASLERIQTALEGAGILFLAKDQKGGLGVRKAK